MMSSSPEDVATRALELLLGRSKAARAALDRLLAEWRGRPGPSAVRWVSQVVGSDRSRTDLEGFDSNDGVAAILENKFWAHLTDNQPAAYLKRLQATEGVLVFVTPSSRVLLLAEEVALRTLGVDAQPCVFVGDGESRVARLRDGTTLVVTSWDVVLASIGTSMDAAGEFDNVLDLKQLQALVAKMDQEAFRPFTVADLTGAAPRLVLRLCGLVDSVVGMLDHGRPHISRRGLRLSSGAGWYGYGLVIHGVGCQLIWSAERWADRGLSPLWFRVAGPSWKFSEASGRAVRAVVPDLSWVVEERATGWPGHWLPLRIAEGRDRQAVVNDLVGQIDRIAEQLGADRRTIDGAGALEALSEAEGPEPGE